MITESGGTRSRRVVALTVAVAVVSAVAVWRLWTFDDQSARWCTATELVAAPALEASPEAAFDAWWEWEEGGPAAAVDTYDIGDTAATVTPPSWSDFERESELRWYWDVDPGGVQVDVEQTFDGWRVSAVNACGVGFPG